MGQTVVFTVSTDSDDVSIASTESQPPRRPILDAARAALRDRRWHIALLVTFAVPALAAAITAALTGGAWVTTTFLAMAALVTPASGAWAAARRYDGPLPERSADLLVAGIAGGLLAFMQVPGVVLATRAENWDQTDWVHVLAVLVLTGAAGALVGKAVAASGRSGAGWRASALMVALGLLPLALYTALLPTTKVTETVTELSFTTVYDLGRPAYVCGTQEVERTRAHTELIAWIAQASPMVWVIDAPSLAASELAGADDGTAAQVQAWTRSTRVGPDSFTGHCYAPTSLGVPTAVREARYENVRPFGINAASILFIGAAGVAAATSLKSPSRRQSR
jgi:hypothetical protein